MCSKSNVLGNKVVDQIKKFDRDVKHTELRNRLAEMYPSLRVLGSPPAEVFFFQNCLFFCFCFIYWRENWLVVDWLVVDWLVADWLVANIKWRAQSSLTQLVSIK